VNIRPSRLSAAIFLCHNKTMGQMDKKLDDYLTGQLLVAMPGLQDPRFAER